MRLKAEFVKSGVNPEDYPEDDKLEIAIAGRSNAGKSSFINAITSSDIAKTSSKPGKTILLNFFNIGEHYRLVDMPGYGYSARSGNMQRSWQRLVETYLDIRENLTGVILLVDCRRDWSEDEQLLVNWLNRIGRPVVLVLTKADQLKAPEQKTVVKEMIKKSRLKNIFLISSLKKTGIKELEDFIFTNWIKPHIGGRK